MKQPSRIILIALTLVFAVMCITASACPTCKDGLAGDPAYSNMVNGYFWSILFMMSMPFLVFTGVATYFYCEIRRGRRQRVAAAASDGAPANASPDPEIVLQS